MTIQQLADKIERLTDENMHTEARVALANYLGGKFPKIMGAIKTIHDTEGSMPDGVHEYRHSIYKQMIAETTNRFGQLAADIIKSSF